MRALLSPLEGQPSLGFLVRVSLLPMLASVETALLALCRAKARSHGARLRESVRLDS